MATAFYELAKPISSLRIDNNGGHAKVSVFIEGKLAGELVFDSPRTPDPDRSSALRRYLFLLIGEEVAVRVGIGGGKTAFTRTKKPRTKQVISEYCELHEVSFSGDSFSIHEKPSWSAVRDLKGEKGAGVR